MSHIKVFTNSCSTFLYRNFNALCRLLVSIVDPFNRSGRFIGMFSHWGLGVDAQASLEKRRELYDHSCWVTWVAYDGQQKYTICDACRPCHSIQSTVRPIFRENSTDLLCLWVAKVPRYRNLAILLLTLTMTTMTTAELITLPLPHACTVNMTCMHCSTNNCHDDRTYTWLLMI